MASEALERVTAAERGLRHEGAVRLAAVSRPGEAVHSLALAGDEVVAGSARRLDLATLGERLPKPLDHPAHPEIVLEDGDVELDLDDLETVRAEKILALAPEHGIAITSIVSKGGDRLLGRRSEYTARVLALATGKRRGLAIGRQTVAAGIAPDGKGAILLDENGGVLCYDLVTQAYPGSARAREPENGKWARIALATGGRIWLASTGGSVEVRVMNDAKAAATLDVSGLGDEVTSAIFLPDGRGFLVGTERGVVMRFDLLLDHVGTSRDARLAAIADVVDAWIAGTRWIRYQPRVEVYEEQTEGGRTTWFFVASDYEYHHAQSGSDWAEHYLCAGHATFDDARCVDVRLTSTEPRQITERDDESYDAAAEVAAFKAAAARARSSSTAGS